MDKAEAEYARQKEGLDAFSAEQAEYVPAWKARVDEFEERQLNLGANSVFKNDDNPYAVKVIGTLVLIEVEDLILTMTNKAKQKGRCG